MKEKKNLQSLKMESFVGFLLELERSQMLTKADVFNIVADVFDCAAENQLTYLFDIMESKVFKSELLNVKEDEKNLLLNYCSKICKIILRKLSITHDIGFRGRVQTLIASVFPLSHPSGLNKAGNFNLKNTTNFESLEEVKVQLEQQKQGSISDYKLYKNFWNLQKYLINPFNVKRYALNYQQIFSSAKLDFEEIEEEDFVEPDYEYGASKEKNKEDQIMGEDGSIGDEEEGQAENERSMSIDESITKIDKRQPNAVESNLGQVLSTIRDLINRFQQQPLQIDKDNAQILKKYPKYLSKYSLLNLQFQDYLFRETFMVQVLIFVQSILNPINNQQKKYFVLTENDRKLLQNIEQRVYQLLSDQNDSSKPQSILGKRKTMSECAETIINREKFWSKWKENKSMKFEKEPSKMISRKKRDAIRSQKLLGNPKVIQHKERELNHPTNGDKMKKYLKQPKESLDTEMNSINIKPCEMPTINTFLNPILIDLDPDQDIEEQYKHKKNQVHCWRFLRELSFIDLVNFHGKPELQKQFNKFEGNAEEQALIIYKKNMKKEIQLNGGDAHNEEAIGYDLQKNGGGSTEIATNQST